MTHRTDAPDADADRIRELVDAAPRLTDEQCRHLAVLLLRHVPAPQEAAA